MLSEERIVELAEEYGLCTIVKDAGYKNDALWFDADLTEFARAIEREAHKQGQEAMRGSALTCYSPDDTAQDWSDKIRALPIEELRN